jgi:PBSX family phage terminase large subunit
MNDVSVSNTSSIKTTAYADLLAHLLPTTSADYIPHQKQLQFHYALLDSDVVLFNGGRGSGKTTSGAVQAVAEAEFSVSRGVIVAPTYPMLRDATMAEFFKWLPRESIAHWHKTDKLLTLQNGSEIAFRSADSPDSLRGPNRDWLWFDEPRNVSTRDAFDVVFAQLRPRRKAWLTTTPAGIFHWLYHLFIEHPISNSRVIVVKTSENPYLPDDYSNTLRQMYTGVFAAQELDAQWVSFEGLIYDNFSLAENVTESAAYNPDLPVMWGVDDGYAFGQGRGTESYHPRVILFMQETAQGGMNVFAEYVACGELEEVTLDNALAIDYHRPELVYIDSSATQLKARIWAKGITTYGATHQVSEGIKNVRRLIGDGNGVRLLKIHPSCKELIREMQSYRRNPNTAQVKNGEVAPLKMDDHTLDARRYALWKLRY